MADNKITPVVADPYDMAAKQIIHPKADAKNRLEVIRSVVQLTCGARKKKGPGFCKCKAGHGTQHPGYGRCKFCGGSSTGPKTPEGRAAASQNTTKHGFYSEALSPDERAAYEEDLAAETALSLDHEIRMLRVKIKRYLVKWREKWEAFYESKLSEMLVKYECTNVDCKRTYVMGELSGKPTYCTWCNTRSPQPVDSWLAEHPEQEAQRYADDKSKVFYSEGEGARSFYHAGTLEDRTLDRAMNTLSRLIEKHARLNPDQGDDLVGKINAELKQASQGKINISWGGKAQARKEGGKDE